MRYLELSAKDLFSVARAINDAYFAQHPETFDRTVDGIPVARLTTSFVQVRYNGESGLGVVVLDAISEVLLSDVARVRPDLLPLLTPVDLNSVSTAAREKLSLNALSVTAVESEIGAIDG